MRALILAAGLAVCGAAAPAQPAGTLADIRQDLSALFFEMQRLRQELNTTGGSAIALPTGTLDRIGAIESELQRLTAKAEELEFRIGRVVEDGTNRIGDLDFRLCELEPDCDIATLEPTARLGGAAVPATPPAAGPAPSTDATPQAGQLAVSEQADFAAAQTALEAGDFTGAAQLFAAFRDTYPQGPLDAAALVGEGRALEGTGDIREAARRYLRAYTDYPDAESAPEALWRLGVQLGALGSVPEACVTLAEVGVRYPASDYVARAGQSRDALGCS